MKFKSEYSERELLYHFYCPECNDQQYPKFEDYFEELVECLRVLPESALEHPAGYYHVIEGVASLDF